MDERHLCFLGDADDADAATQQPLVPRTFEPRRSDVYVASYMKSGTTWVLYLVRLLVRLRAGDGDAFARLTDVCPWIEAVDARAPTADRGAALNALPAPRVIKTHALPRHLPPVGRVVCVVRDPCDVAVSLYAHAIGFQAFDDTFERFLELMGRGGCTYFGNFAPWPAHVRAWLDEAARDPAQVLVVRYEDLLADAAGTIARLAAFLGIDASVDELEHVRELATFERMRAQAERFNYVWQDAESQERFSFFRVGRAGTWREHASREAWAAFRAAVAADLRADGRDSAAHVLLFGSLG